MFCRIIASFASILRRISRLSLQFMCDYWVSDSGDCLLTHNTAAKFLNRLTLLLLCLLVTSAHGDTMCFGPVKKKSGDVSSERPWWVPFDYRVQIDGGPIVKPSAKTSTPYDFSSESPLVKIWLGDEIVESFRVPEEVFKDGRNCIYFKNLYETWSIAEKWQTNKLCSCPRAGTNAEIGAELMSAARGAFSEDISSTSIADALAQSTWNTERTATAAAITAQGQSQVVAFLLREDGAYQAIDVSRVERANLMKLQQDPNFDRVESRPIGWIEREDELYQIEIQTRAWRSGQRFTVSEKLLIEPNGKVLWR